MLEYHATLEILPGGERAFEEFCRAEYSTAMLRHAGILSVELLRERTADQRPEASRYVMLIRAESAETAARWSSSDDHRALGPRLKALCGSIEVKVYDVVA
jgi:heme-degrading monooxygenase HmoA